MCLQPNIEWHILALPCSHSVVPPEALPSTMTLGP